MIKDKKIVDCCTAILMFYHLSEIEYELLDNFDTSSNKNLMEITEKYGYIPGLVDFTTKTSTIILWVDKEKDFFSDVDYAILYFFDLMKKHGGTEEQYWKDLEKFCIKINISYNLVKNSLAVSKFSL